MHRRLLASAAGLAVAASLSFATPAAAAPKSFDHAYVIMMENQSFDNLVGHDKFDANGNNLGPDTPFITKSALTEGLATLYFGVTHPSLPNYVATISGDYFGIQDDASSCYALPTPDPGCHKITAPNLVDRLEANHLKFIALMETMPSQGYLGTQYPSASPRLYAQKHNPFVYFQDIAQNKARLDRIKPLLNATLDETLANPPSLTYIVPNQCHDMHGTSTCTDFDGLLRTGDKYLERLVTKIASSRGYTKNSAIFVVWDEDDYSSNLGCCSSLPSLGGGHTLTLVYSATSVQKRSATPYNHYSLLRTLLEGFKLAPLGHSNDSDVQPMWDLF